MKNLRTKKIFLLCLFSVISLETFSADLPWYIGTGEYKLNQTSDYNADHHKYRKDRFSGYEIGVDLYQAKFTELGNMIRSTRLFVENLTEDQRKNLGKQKKINLYSDDSKQALINKLVEEKIVERNKGIIDRMNRMPLPSPGPHQVATIKKQQLLETVSSILQSPATDDIGELKKYFDKDGGIGFCFGRAHYQVSSALNRGLMFESLAKVFIVGKMMPLGIIPLGAWQFHVAGAARSEDGSWMAMDNHLPKFTEKTYTVTDWYDYYDKYLNTTDDFHIRMNDGSYEKARVKALFLFFTEADKIGASTNAYNKEITWGFDNNKDLKIDQTEVSYGNYFAIVDKFIAESHPRLCDPVRYKKESSGQCSADEIKSAVLYRQQIIEPYRQLRMMDEERRRHSQGG